MFDAADIDTGKDQAVVGCRIDENEGAGFKARMDALGGLLFLTKAPHGTAVSGACDVGHAAPYEIVTGVLCGCGREERARKDEIDGAEQAGGCR